MISFLNLILVILAISMGIAALVMLLKGSKKEETKKKGAPKPYPIEEESEATSSEESMESQEEEEIQEDEEKIDEAEESEQGE